MEQSNLSSLTEDKIAECLAVIEPGSIESGFPQALIAPEPRPAAVLIPFLQIRGEWHLLYIRRTSKLNDPHSGQVAFPGGALDPEDTSLQATALREMHEEIGIAPDDVRILGRLHDFVTITSFQVTPFIGRIPWPYLLMLEQNEVSRAFTIPLAWLADPRNHRIQQRALPPPYEPVPVVYFEPYDGEVLWGATAGFTLALLDALDCGV